MRQLYAGLALAMLLVLPFQTGVQRLLEFWGAPAPLQFVVTGLKELLLGIAAVALAAPVLGGSVRVRSAYGLTVLALSVFSLGLVVVWVVTVRDIAGAYAVRVYVEPVAYGLAAGGLAALARSRNKVLLVVIWSVIPVVGLALYQVARPAAPLVSGLRNIAAVNGDLPSAFWVSIVNVFRPFSFFSDPNDMGLFLVLALLCIATYGAVVARRRRFWIVTVGSLAGLGIFLSFSRSALAALGGGVVAMLVADWFQTRRLPVFLSAKLMRIPILLGTVLAAALFTVLLPGTPQVRHLWNTVTEIDPSSAGHVRSLRAGLRQSIQYPTGVGLGRVGPRAARYGHAHKELHVEDSYLQMSLEAGAAFAVLYVVILLSVLLASVGIADPTPLEEDLRFRRLAAGATVAVGLSYVFLPLVVSLQTGALYWAIVACDMIQPPQATGLGS